MSPPHRTNGVMRRESYPGCEGIRLVAWSSGAASALLSRRCSVPETARRESDERRRTRDSHVRAGGGRVGEISIPSLAAIIRRLLFMTHPRQWLFLGLQAPGVYWSPFAFGSRVYVYRCSTTYDLIVFCSDVENTRS